MKSVRKEREGEYQRAGKGCCRDYAAGVGSPTTSFDGSFRILEFTKTSSPSPSPSKPTPPSKTKPVIPEDEFTKATSVWEELGRMIQNITDDIASAPSIPLEELLVHHDELGELVKWVQEKMPMPVAKGKPTLTLPLSALATPTPTCATFPHTLDGSIPEEAEAMNRQRES